jgi:hypothetical protein
MRRSIPSALLPNAVFREIFRNRSDHTLYPMDCGVKDVFWLPLVKTRIWSASSFEARCRRKGMTQGLAPCSPQSNLYSSRRHSAGASRIARHAAGKEHMAAQSNTQAAGIARLAGSKERVSNSSGRTNPDNTAPRSRPIPTPTAASTLESRRRRRTAVGRLAPRAIRMASSLVRRATA